MVNSYIHEYCSSLVVSAIVTSSRSETLGWVTLRYMRIAAAGWELLWSPAAGQIAGDGKQLDT